MNGRDDGLSFVDTNILVNAIAGDDSKRGRLPQGLFAAGTVCDAHAERNIASGAAGCPPVHRPHRGMAGCDFRFQVRSANDRVVDQLHIVFLGRFDCRDGAELGGESPL